MAELHPVLQAWFDARDKALQYAMHLQDRELRQQQLEESKIQHQNQLKMDQARIDQDVALANLRKAGLRLQATKMMSEGEIPGRSNFDTGNYEGQYGINENLNRISRGQDPQAETMTANIEGLGNITGYTPQAAGQAQFDIQNPLLEAKSRGMQALAILKAKSEFEKMQEQERLKKETAESVADKNIASREKISKEQINARLAAARIKAKNSGGLENLLRHDKQVSTAKSMFSDFERNPTMRAADQLTAMYDQMKSVAELSSGAAAVQAITNFAKSADSLSAMNAVRESEFKNAATAQGWIESIKNVHESVLKGKKVSRKTINDYIVVVGKMRDSLKKHKDRRKNMMFRQMKAYGISDDIQRSFTDPEDEVDVSGMFEKGGKSNASNVQ